ncbi:MAG TPA: GAP family protein [Solirubrobacteraceae bacterium]|nr:GAP family protein [Solirubrobacteraceae bacterium]
MTSVYAELGLVALAAMLSPTTLSFSVFALVLGDRPLRTGFWFYVGALAATLAVGVAAAFVLGGAAAPKSGSATPPTWVSVLDIAFAVLIAGYVAWLARRPASARRTEEAIRRMERLSSSPAVAVVGAGAALANPGGFLPVALKDISQLNPSAAEYCLLWLLFSLATLLPLSLALICLLVSRDRTTRALAHAREWLERHARTLAFAIVLLLAAALLRNGIVGLTG